MTGVTCTTIFSKDTTILWKMWEIDWSNWKTNDFSNSPYDHENTYEQDLTMIYIKVTLFIQNEFILMIYDWIMILFISFYQSSWYE